jgi:glycosyltransferase involved in cell wall biosynthesis
MRIWFAAAQKKDTYGGVYRSVLSLAEGLRRHGHEVDIWWSGREGKAAPFLFLLFLLSRLIRSCKRPPHWIIARSGDGLLCALAARSRLVPTRVALHSHGWEEKVFSVEQRLPRAVISHPTTWKSRIVRFPLLRATLGSVPLCICGTVEEARWLKGRYPKRRHIITVVPNGCVPAAQPYWPMQAELPPDFLVVGGFTWKKNVDYAIDIFCHIVKSLPGARLFCVGTGPVPPRHRTLIDGLGDAALFVERELPDAMVRWYETCPFLISASRYEGGRSLAILEAQNRGMVAFATAIPSTKEIIRDRKNGVLLTGIDAAADGALIAATCGDSNLCKAIGTAAWRSAGRQSWERQVQRLDKILNMR